MTLRTRLVLLTSGLVVVFVVVTLAVVNQMLMGYFTREAHHEAENTAVALDQSLRASLGSYRVEGQLVADETILKESIVKGSSELTFTYADAARDRSGVHYLAITSVDGRIIADATGGESASRAGPISRAVAPTTEPRTGFMMLGDQLAVVAIVPITLGDRVIGMLILGDPVSADRLRSVERVWSASVTLVAPGGGSIVSTLSGDAAARVARASECGGALITRDLEVDGDPQLLVVEALRDVQGEPLGCIAVTRSLSSRIEALRSLQRLLLLAGLGLTAVALVVAVVLAVRVTAAITRPLMRLAEAARGLQRGDLTARAPVIVQDEIGALSKAFNLMGDAVASRQGELTRELELARQIQLALLPKELAAPGFDLAAHMEAASEVGGDYYDVLPVPNGCWIGIGDVAGHGLDAGLVVLMIQCVVAAMVRKDPDAHPRDVVLAVNSVLFENIRHRLAKDLHATFSMLRFARDGRVVFAGAHEAIIVCRAVSGRCEVIETPGTWVGAVADVDGATVDVDISLADGDLMVLYTDGLIEARCTGGGRFGLDRLCAEIELVRREPLEVIQRHLFAALVRVAPTRDDDVSIVVVRYLPQSDKSVEAILAEPLSDLV